MIEKIINDAFIFELILSYLAFIPFLNPRKLFWLKFILCLAISICFSQFVPFSLNNVPRIAAIVYGIGYYAAVWALTVATIRICFEGSGWHALFCAVGAYAIQHIFYQLRNFVFFFLTRQGVLKTWLEYFVYILSVAVVLLLAYVLFIRRICKEKDFKTNNKRLILMSGTALLVTVILSYLVKEFTLFYTQLTEIIYIVITCFSVVCCLLILDNLMENVYSKKLEDEVQIIQNLWKNDRRQYEISKQNIDLMNIKYHDLKYHLRAYLKNNDELSEVANCLDLYGAMLKTGNETLDVTLTEKKLQCDKLDIRLSCVVDGEKLNFMNAVDIYSLFGNALDNSIECLKEVEDSEKKSITVSVRRVNDFVKIQIENFVSSAPIMVKGYPRTTKIDTSNHGYGLKSMDYIVKKYDGILHFGFENNIFLVDIMLPIA